MKRILTVLSLLAMSIVSGNAQILVETETFENRGGWSLDQQFIDQMGSSYLIAHGLGKPVADASTTVEIPAAGQYHIYVRTFNWTSPWTSEAGPGAFKVKVNGKALKTVLGTEGDSWCWQYAGAVKLKAGVNAIALSDLRGFDGRCDAIWITPDQNDVPPTEVAALDSFRRAQGAIKTVPSKNGSYDMVVVGAGIGGMCAAVSAARQGLKVALVSDRAILGGNNSSEIRVHLGGMIELEPYTALGKMQREFGHSKGGNAQPASNYEDEKKDAFIKGEQNVAYFPLTRAVKVNMKDKNTIASVVCRNVETGEEFVLSAPLFSDCTGDGQIGFLAGADWRAGREARSEFHESLAPVEADDLHMGASVQWYSVEGAKSAFPEFNYGITFSDESCEKVKMGEWTWETGMDRDMIDEFERVRDYGMLVIYSNWSYLKNHYSKKADYAARELGWVAYTAGKRESRRLMGDYILSQEDIDKSVFHEDASFTTNWHMDLHFPDPANSKYFPGMEFKAETKHNPIYPYAVPFRCLYSRNINNLFMAGRNISVTHVALGTVRLMRTIGIMGEVVGMAAEICRKHDILPRDVYQHHLPELQELMKKGSAKGDNLPDNQHFNEGGFNKTPRVKVEPRDEMPAMRVIKK